MNNLILVRHGQSKFNLQRRFTGFYDVELTSKGQNEATAGWWAEYQIAKPQLNFTIF